MADRLRYAIHNCRSIDMDNYMLSRNMDATGAAATAAGHPASDDEY